MPNNPDKQYHLETPATSGRFEKTPVLVLIPCTLRSDWVEVLVYRHEDLFVFLIFSQKSNVSQG